MTKEQAYFIGFLRAGPLMHSWRDVAKKVHEIYPELTPKELSTNQVEGDHLCKAAFQIIYGFYPFEAPDNSQAQKILKEWGY